MSSFKKIQLLINNSDIELEIPETRKVPNVCFLGPSGTYTEEAKNIFLNGQKFIETPLKTNPEVVQLVDNFEYDLGVIPVENSLEGDVVDTLRGIIRATNIKILGEVILPIQHMLIGKKNQNIKKILSHPQALAQCSKFLEENYPNVELIVTTSTAEAVKQTIKMENAAAIGSKKVAEIYNLPIIKENIGNNNQNATRFILIGRGVTQPTTNDATTLIFVTKDRPGILAECLNLLASYKINLNKIDSYPTGEEIRKYMFLISLDGHIKNAQVEEAIMQLKNKYCLDLKILGSYQKAELPKGINEPRTINI